MAAAVATALGFALTECQVERFPDGELRPVVANVRGDDVFVVQPTGPSVNAHVMELLLLLDACRRAGAERVTAVIPYFGYARQDRRGSTGEALGARVVADALVCAGARRLVVVDPHTVALEAICSVPLESLSAAPVLATALEPVISEDAVVVAPDLGAVKLAERYAALLGRPVAVVRKTRVSGASVRVEELVGDVHGHASVVVDDMIGTGGTIEAAVRLLLARRARIPVVVAATHGLLVGAAGDRLAAVPSPPVPLERHSIATLLADAIGRLHRNEDLADLLVHA